MASSKNKSIFLWIITIALFVLVLGTFALLLYNRKEPAPQNKKIAIYFNNNQFDPNFSDCGKTYPVFRIINDSVNLPEAALKELFKGPTEQEKEQGYVSWFSPQTEFILKNLKIKNNTVYVDLIDIRPIIPNASSSCGSAEFLSEIENTLKQFPEIEKIIFAINEKPSDFYEWIQVGCDKQLNNCDEKPFVDFNK
ncbi:MAG: GerMN domain-containing protein [Patescibacteria group bacterium]